MIVLAHRGFHVDRPENTHEAFRAAAALGADGIETDVRLTSDEIAVLFHDRIAPDGRAVAEMTARELSEVAGYSVPSLADAVERWDVLWNLEIKAPAALEATRDVVARFNGTRRFLVSSFWHDVARRAHQRMGVDAGLLVAHRPASDRPLRSHFGLTAGVETLIVDCEVVDDALVRMAAEEQVRLYVYNVMSRGELMRLRGLGVAAAITDRPDYLVDTVSRCDRAGTQPRRQSPGRQRRPR